MQRSFIVFVTLILYSNRVNIYLKFLKTLHGMATIIISKVTDRLLLNSKSGNENSPDLDKTDKVQDLSEDEIHGLYYITGYILRKLFTKIKKIP